MRTRTLMIALAVSLFLPLGQASAQTATAPPPPPETGAIDKLSPGNQTIAKAIFADQVKPTTGAGTGTVGSSTGSSTPQPLTLDQIAQRKLDGQGWGVIFKDMKAQGLVTSKNLGQAVSAFHPQHHMTNPGAATTASGRTFDDAAGSPGRAPASKGARDDVSGQGVRGPGNSSTFSSNPGQGSMGAGNPGHGGNAFGRVK